LLILYTGQPLPYCCTLERFGKGGFPLPCLALFLSMHTMSCAGPARHSRGELLLIPSVRASPLPSGLAFASRGLLCFVLMAIAASMYDSMALMRCVTWLRGPFFCGSVLVLL
jgi:hypothetical protein